MIGQDPTQRQSLSAAEKPTLQAVASLALPSPAHCGRLGCNESPFFLHPPIKSCCISLTELPTPIAEYRSSMAGIHFSRCRIAYTFPWASMDSTRFALSVRVAGIVVVEWGGFGLGVYIAPLRHLFVWLGVSSTSSTYPPAYALSLPSFTIFSQTVSSSDSHRPILYLLKTRTDLGPFCNTTTLTSCPGITAHRNAECDAPDRK